MSALKLDESITTAVKQLGQVLEAVAKVRATGTLSDESYNFFEMGSTFCAQMNAAKNLIATREIVFEAATNYPDNPSPNSLDKFLYGGGEVSFGQGRYLLLQSYMTTTWAIYDSLSKIAGVLCCCDQLAKNQAKAVKLPEHFLRDSKAVGARVRDHLKGGYGWPVAISYAVRNWLVHDGSSHNGVELFKYELGASAPFELADDAWAKIVEKCKGEYDAGDTQTRLRPFPDVRADLLKGMQICHQEVDEAVSFLMLWSVGIIELQTKLLLKRDIN